MTELRSDHCIDGGQSPPRCVTRFDRLFGSDTLRKGLFSRDKKVKQALLAESRMSYCSYRGADHFYHS